MKFLPAKRANTLFGPFLLLCSLASVFTEISYMLVRKGTTNEECIEDFGIQSEGEYYSGIWGPLPSFGVFTFAILIKCHLTRTRLVIEFIFTILSIVGFLVFIIFNSIIFGNMDLDCDQGFAACNNNTNLNDDICQNCKTICEEDVLEVQNIYILQLTFAILGIVFTFIITLAIGLTLVPQTDEDSLQEGRFVQAFQQEKRRNRAAAATAKNQKVTFEKNTIDPASRQISNNSQRVPEFRRQDSNLSRKSSSGSKKSTQSGENVRKLSRMDSFPSSILK